MALREMAGSLDVTIKLIATDAEGSGGEGVAPTEGVFDDVTMATLVRPAPGDACAWTSQAITLKFVSACATPSAGHAVCDGVFAMARIGLAATDDAQREQLSGTRRKRLIDTEPRRVSAPAAGGAL